MEARRDRSVSYSQDIPVDDGDGVTARALRFAEDGYLCPLRVLTKEQEDHTRAGLEALLNRHGGQLPHLFRHKLHLMYDWADALIHNQAILDAVENVLGPDILCWTSNVLVKNAGDSAFVSWHQDAFYWGLEPNEVVTVWVALTPSTPESGCVQVIPGTHRAPVLPHPLRASAWMLPRALRCAPGALRASALMLPRALRRAPGALRAFALMLPGSSRSSLFGGRKSR